MVKSKSCRFTGSHGQVLVDEVRAPRLSIFTIGRRRFYALGWSKKLSSAEYDADDLKLGDMVLFYHSNTKPPHVAGIARVSREGYPDHTSWDPDSKYYDEKSSPRIHAG